MAASGEGAETVSRRVHIQKGPGMLVVFCGRDLRRVKKWDARDRVRDYDDEEYCIRCERGWVEWKDTCLDEVYLTRWDCQPGRLEAAA